VALSCKPSVKLALKGHFRWPVIIWNSTYLHKFMRGPTIFCRPAFSHLYLTDDALQSVAQDAEEEDGLDGEEGPEPACGMGPLLYRGRRRVRCPFVGHAFLFSKWEKLSLSIIIRGGIRVNCAPLSQCRCKVQAATPRKMSLLHTKASHTLTHLLCLLR